MRGRLAWVAMVALLGMASANYVQAAQDRTVYFGIGGLADFPEGDLHEVDVTATETQRPLPDDDLGLETGWGVTASVGAYIGKHWRAEFQYTGITNDVNEVTSLGQSFDADGTVYSNLFMLNVLYDIPLADRLSMYVGGGMGVIYTRLDADITWDPSVGEVDFIHGQNGTGFAYQGMIGLEYQLTPMLSVTGGYRVWNCGQVNLQDSKEEYDWQHVVELGLRVSF